MKFKIDVVTYSVDRQDGSFGIYVFNDIESLAKDLGFDKEKIELILSEDDPYENGTIGEDKIEIEVVNGVAKLSRHISLSSD